MKTEDFTYAAVAVIFRLCKPVTLLQLLLVPDHVSQIQTPSIVTHNRDNVNWREKPKYSKITRPSATSSTTNPT
jgi:hypothetical protein